MHNVHNEYVAYWAMGQGVTFILFQEGVLKRALDVGCSVGRSAFELARDFDEVVGIDYSNTFIQRCQELKRTGHSTYKLMTEGALGEEKTATIHPDIVSESR